MSDLFFSDTPDQILSDIEINDLILRLGSLASLIHNKKLSPPKLLTFILHNPTFQKIALQATETDDKRFIVSQIVLKYPIIARSKIVSRTVKRKHGNIKPTTNIQQLPPCATDVHESTVSS